MKSSEREKAKFSEARHVRESAILIPLLLAGAAIGAELQTFDTKASVASWTFHNGPEFPGAAGGIAWDAKQGHDRPGCLALEYSFAGGGNYVQATCSLPADNDGHRADVWLHKPAGHRITFRGVDSAGQVFQKSADFTCDGWQKVEVDLTRWVHHWGGPGDGKLRPPIRQFAILVENTAELRQGRLLIDNLAFLPESPPTDAGPGTYVAEGFTTGRWWARGGAGNQLSDKKWSYTFNEGSAPGLSTDYSILGEPATLRLVVDSDGSGRGVQMEIGSHFQNFHRLIGTLSTKGEQVLESPLGRMTEWQHSDGENDGLARLPLRLRGITLSRGDGPASGMITLKRIEIDTRPRNGQVVLLVPDVRTEGDAVHFSVRLTNMRERVIQGRLVCDSRNLGGLLKRHETPMTLPGDGRTADWTFSRPLGDDRYFEASFQWIEPGFTSQPAMIGTCLPPEDPGSAELQPDSRVGAGLYLYRFRHSANAREQMTRSAALAQRAGIKWSREEILWDVTEPVEGQLDWTFYDEMVGVAHAHGISIYGLLDYWSPWAAKDTPEGVEQYCRWVRQVVRHYKGRIKHWEIWNEPNIFFWSGPRELYAKLLADAYEAIKAEDPDAQVLGCSTAGIDLEFIRKVMDWGGKFDALTIHPYRGVMNDIGFIDELRNAQQLVGGRDVWLTEMGFPSQLLDGYSERQQASLAARVYLCSLASGAVRSASWYDFRNDGSDAFYNEFNFGLVRQDFRLKPGYGSLATLGRTIGSHRVAGPIDVGAGAYAFRFTDGPQNIVAVCAPDNGRLLSYRAPQSTAITNAFGEPVGPIQRDGTSSLTLYPGFPVYIVGPAGFSFEPVDPAVTYGPDRTTARAGQKIALRITPALPVTAWELPAGWPDPVSGGDGTYNLSVPVDAPTGHVEFQATIDAPGRLSLPVRILIQPAVIQL